MKVVALPGTFIPPMLCERLTDPARLVDRRYVAEPKLDGQRAQLHIRGGRALAFYSCRGLELLRHPGMARLRELAWPVDSTVLDGEAWATRTKVSRRCSPSGSGPNGAMAFALFDGSSFTTRASCASAGVIAESGSRTSRRNAASAHRHRADHGGRARLLRDVGRHGRRGHRPEGSGIAVRPGRVLAGVAQAEAQAHARGRRDRRLSDKNCLGPTGVRP
jgi:hypothetical protein